MSPANAALVVVALAFAWSMGAHYTGACMGMPFATGSIRLRPALMLMAALTLLGAVFLSNRVLTNIGHNILTGGSIGAVPAIVIIGVAFLLTTLFTQLRIPTSTIQILVFCVLGAGRALGLAINWTAIVQLVILWVLAPLVACALGFVFTRLLDLAPRFVDSGAAGSIGKALVIDRPGSRGDSGVPDHLGSVSPRPLMCAWPASAGGTTLHAFAVTGPSTAGQSGAQTKDSSRPGSAPR